MMRNIRTLLTGKSSLSDIWHYLLGHYRYKLYYNRKQELKDHNALKSKLGFDILTNPPKHFLMRQHIYEQIIKRIQWMDRECFDQGSCKICGCGTTALQMANKSCDKPCYPPMMNKRDWKEFKAYKPYYANRRQLYSNIWILDKFTNRPDLFRWDGNLYKNITFWETKN